MRQFMKYAFCLALVMLMAAPVFARQVQILEVPEENMGAMQLRQNAMATAFAEAMVQEAQSMLPGELPEERIETLREYMVVNSKPYVQGYKVISSQMTEEGLALVLDVKVNTRSLRERLNSLGFFTTAMVGQPATVQWPDAFDEDTVAHIQKLMTFSGLSAPLANAPVFTFEPFAEQGVYKGRLAYGEHEWTLVNKDMDVVWLSLWAKYFGREQKNVTSNRRRVQVTGWFSPDGALEFDRILKGWENAVQDVVLQELDMQSVGVSGTWSMRLINQARLEMLLQTYLPQRGLTYRLTESAKE